MSIKSDNKKRKSELLDPNKDLLYESNQLTEREDLLDNSFHIAAFLHEFRLVKIVGDKQGYSEVIQQYSAIPVVFTMQRGDTVLEAEVWVQGDGGYHPSSGGIRLLLEREVVAGTHSRDDEKFDSAKLCRLFGLPESDGETLRVVLNKTLKKDWFARVKRFLVIERKKYTDQQDDDNYLRMAQAHRAISHI